MTIKLQKYIFRELFRAFLLTAIALTCMMGFGGGMLDVFKGQGITAKEAIKLIVLLMPIVFTYSLPIAALFSTTITYGRFSADNEINACRASGINIFKLLVPAFVLSIIVSGSTFFLENYIIPEMASRSWQLVKKDMQTIAYLQLKHRGYLSGFNFALHCGRVDDMQMPELQGDGRFSRGRITLSQVAFINSENNRPVFYGTARAAHVFFDHTDDDMAVTVALFKVHGFDEEQGDVRQAEFFTIGPLKVPKVVKRKIKFLSLPDLVDILDEPAKFPGLEGQTKQLHAKLRTSLAYEAVVAELRKSGQIGLNDKRGVEFVITADRCEQKTRADGRITLNNNVKVVRKDNHGVTHTFYADAMDISAKDFGPQNSPRLDLRLKNVRIRDAKDVDPDRYTHRDRHVLGSLLPPTDIIAQANTYSLEKLLDAETSLHMNDDLDERRSKAATAYEAVFSKCVAEINARMSYSASALFLLTLGAALGIIFRGGHLVSAFGLSFIPLMIVVVFIMTGKQISSAGIIGLGTVISWTGCAIVAVANVVVLGKFLKR